MIAHPLFYINDQMVFCCQSEKFTARYPIDDHRADFRFQPAFDELPTKLTCEAITFLKRYPSSLGNFKTVMIDGTAP